MKADLGELKAQSLGHSTWQVQHTAEDKVMADDIQEMKVVQARQKGYLAGVGTAGSVLGATIGWFLERMVRGH